MNDGLDSIGPEHPIAWASASATILILQLQASKMLHKTHAWIQAVKNGSYSETTWSLGAFYNLESSGCCLDTFLWLLLTFYLASHWFARDFCMSLSIL